MKENVILRSGKKLLRVAVPIVLLQAYLPTCGQRKAGPVGIVTQTIQTSCLTSRTLHMKTHPRKKPLTFGEFVAAAYRVWGERRAKGFIQLALKAHLIEFRGQNRFVFS
jgi:hypothetical protein